MKYRPYFTLSELKCISDSVKLNSRPSTILLLRYIDKFILDIEHGLRKENYNGSPRPTLAQKLELDPPLVSEIINSASDYNIYVKWEANASLCTVHELSRVYNYRYVNDLMTTEEEAEYENSQVKNRT